MKRSRRMCGAIIGALVSGLGAFMQASAQAAQARAQAKAQRQQAQRDRDVGRLGARRRERQRAQETGILITQTAALGLGGGALTGTSGEVLQANIFEGRFEEAIIANNAEAKARNRETTANALDASASGFRTAAVFGAITPLLNVAAKSTSLGGGFGRA